MSSPEIRPYGAVSSVSKWDSGARAGWARIIVPLFFLLVFAVVDLGRLFFVQMALQHAMRQAARLAVTGNKLADPDNPGSMLSRVDSIILATLTSAPLRVTVVVH